MIAFYAPLKSPLHPTASGDRAMGRALMAALREAGAAPQLVSELRIYDREGDAEVQAELADCAAQEVRRLRASDAAPGWQAWLTYHNYYKAPDLIGPAVADALDIPYIQVESTRARKRLDGPWARFAAAAEDASARADAILYLTHRDGEALRAYAPAGQRLVHLAPFLDRDALPQAAPCTGPMLSVGMLRPGDKLESYRLIAQTLGQVAAPDWRLDIVGGGAAQADVAALMAPFGARVRMRGAAAPEAMADHYAGASLLLWPGVNEAFGLAYLEAQAHGLPVVAQDRPGVRDVLAQAQPDPGAGVAPMAARIDALLADRDARLAAGADGRARVQAQHLRGAAALTLAQVIAEVAV